VTGASLGELVTDGPGVVDGIDEGITVLGVVDSTSDGDKDGNQVGAVGLLDRVIVGKYEGKTVGWVPVGLTDGRVEG